MILRAKYVLPSSHEIFEDGAILLDDDEIIEVGSFTTVARGQTGDVLDLGDVAVLPGFINAHTHLELGHLAGKIPPPESFTAWLRQVRHHREHDPEKVEAIVTDGVRASLEGGATTVTDVTYTGLALSPLQKSPIRKLVHFETLGFDAARGETAFEELRQRLDRAEPDALLTLGISPHAPYSTSEWLYRKCVGLAEERGLPLCSHVAETEAEEEFLRAGTGEYADLLNALGISLDGWSPPRTTPVQALHRLGFFRSCPLLVHGNYIRNEDIPILRDLNITVVYCPRSHAYFGHENHPFEKLFALGVNVAIGTDSLASNPNLSMLDELKFLYRRHPHISPERVLTFATLNGSKTLKVRAKIGGLRAGWKADLIGVRLPAGGRRIAERVLADDSKVVLTMVGGNVCYSAGVFDNEP